ncbi:hypothetical protein CPLU01_11073 [Colletotrichum plurivorum]|uniref:Uncharacterized protein n=1 Tax=Colletotrichum plurivorum TaxID=2175906 RepID=A0A8H6K3I3_9PEZI|nr:hypothetical protein CPLU01_11073 [Colletotrichum plurivorum]
MKFSTALVAPMLAQGSMAAVAIMASMYAGGTAGLIYEAWYWDGGIVDDFTNHTPKTSCKLQGSHGSICEISGYKFTLNSARKGGCNYSDHIGSATIENYRGEVIEVNGERCHEIRMCISSSLGGSSTNGYQCDF